MLASRRNERLESKKAAGASPRPTNVTFYSAHIRGGLFFRQQTEPPLSAYPWQSIFIPAQGSPNTIKTVGGESSPTVFFIKICSFIIYGQHFIY